MKIKSIRNTFVALALGLAVYLPVTARADSGIVSEVITAYQPVKPGTDLSKLKKGDMMVKVCNACKHVALVRIVSVGQGQVTLAPEKCEYCSSMDTYFAVVGDKSGK